MTKVHEINDIEALAEFRPEWEALLARTWRASFFQSLDWLEVYWRHFGAGQRLRTLVVEDDGQIIGFVPFVVKTEHRKVGDLRFLTFPLDAWGSFYGPISPYPAVALAAALRHIVDTPRDWDVLEPRYVDVDGADGGQTARIMSALGLQTHVTDYEPTSMVDLSGTWHGYLAAKSSKWRNNYRRWQRRLEERGKLEYVRYRPRGEAHGDADPKWGLYDVCVEIARKSWQGSSESGTTLSHPEVADFLRDVHATAAQVGALDVNLLVLNDQPLAFAYNYQYRGSVFGLRIGYDPDLADDGVGNLMYCRALEDSFARHDHLYDLGPGSLDCKRYFKTSLDRVVRYSHYHPTAIRAQLLRIKRWLGRDDAPAVAPRELSA